VSLRRCAATDEPERTNWISLLADELGEEERAEEEAVRAADALDALVQGVDAHYRCDRLEPRGDELGAWRVVRLADPAAPSRYVALTEFSTGASFEFRETPVELR
jgi:hypothetical protein